MTTQRTAALLGVNIDHVATLRQARGTVYPDPLHAAEIAEQAGADGITLHLREDRRHIQDADLERICDTIQLPVNLELAATGEMLAIAADAAPQKCCIVPERREELTTEGGLDVRTQIGDLAKGIAALQDKGIEVSLFIDADADQIAASREAGADAIEIHTGRFADAEDAPVRQMELRRIVDGVNYGLELGLIVNAGHGLHYQNVQAVAAIPGVTELNIGHSIVARAVLTGFYESVMTMKMLISEARRPTDT